MNYPLYGNKSPKNTKQWNRINSVVLYIKIISGSYSLKTMPNHEPLKIFLIRYIIYLCKDISLASLHKWLQMAGLYLFSFQHHSSEFHVLKIRREGGKYPQVRDSWKCEFIVLIPYDAYINNNVLVNYKCYQNLQINFNRKVRYLCP